VSYVLGSQAAVLTNSFIITFAEESSTSAWTLMGGSLCIPDGQFPVADSEGVIDPATLDGSATFFSVLLVNGTTLSFGPFTFYSSLPHDTMVSPIEGQGSLSVGVKSTVTVQRLTNNLPPFSVNGTTGMVNTVYFKDIACSFRVVNENTMLVDVPLYEQLFVGSFASSVKQPFLLEYSSFPEPPLFPSVFFTVTSVAPTAAPTAGTTTGMATAGTTRCRLHRLNTFSATRLLRCAQPKDQHYASTHILCICGTM